MLESTKWEKNVEEWKKMVESILFNKPASLQQSVIKFIALLWIEQQILDTNAGKQLLQAATDV
jgi:hypothetical protein